MTRIPALLAAALLGGPISVQADDTPAGAPVATQAAIVRIDVKGTIKISGELTFNAAIPDGSVVGIGAYLSWFDPSYSNTSSSSVQVTVVKRKASFDITVPYRWAVADRSGKIQVSISPSFSKFEGTSRYSAYGSLARAIPLPKNGATVKLTLSGAL